MKKQFICIGWFLMLSAAQAQSLPERAREENYVMSNGTVVGAMDLDTSQVRRLIAIEREYDRGFDGVMAADSLDEAEVARRVDQLGRRRHDGIRAILTAEQYERWARLLADGPPN